MILTIDGAILLNIIHVCCYALAIIPAFLLASSIDYRKIMKIKSNFQCYIFVVLITLALSYLVGEFLFSILTMML